MGNERIPPEATPLARMFGHESEYWTTVSAVEQRAGFKCFYNGAYPTRFDPNHAGDFCGDEGDGPRIAAEVIDFYRGRSCTPVAYVDALSTPGDLGACLLAAGFAHAVQWDGTLMLYVGPDAGRASTAEAELVIGEATRRAWSEIADEEAGADQQSMLQAMYCAQLGDPRIRAYLARVDGTAAAHCLLFSSGGIGRVETVRTLSRYRGRGLAAAVVRRAVEDSLALDHQLTYIFAEDGGAAQSLYTSLGFRTVMTGAIHTYMMGE
ncbi:MAG: GNAT family N-acetyltransferase [Caldilineaceae bacterium]